MNFLLTRSDKKRLAFLSATLVLLVIGAWLVAGPLGSNVVMTITLLLILVTQIQVARYIVKDNMITFRQYESLIGLYFSLDSSIEPLPKSRRHAASPDFLRRVFVEIRKSKPSLVLELGSGISTLVCSYALRKNGAGRLISFDHLSEYKNRTQKLISVHQLESQCEVWHTPLCNYTLNGKTFEWYDFKSRGISQNIDLMIVDGPPAHLQKNSRYPALPLLYSYLSEDALICVDDANRSDEKRIVNEWLSEFSELKEQYVDNEEGMYILRKQQ